MKIWKVRYIKRKIKEENYYYDRAIAFAEQAAALLVDIEIAYPNSVYLEKEMLYRRAERKSYWYMKRLYKHSYDYES